MSNDNLGGFGRLARPLLELIRRLTGLETSFITQIDWDAQQQEILFALNTAELQVAEGALVEWSDSLCRLAFLSNKEQTSDVPTDFPENFGAAQLGIRTFFALPILDGNASAPSAGPAGSRSNSSPTSSPAFG